MKIVTLTCEHCKKEFDRPLKEYNRNIKRGMIRNFCGLSCFAHVRNASLPKEFWQNLYKKRNKKPCRNLDPMSPFRSFLKKCKSRKKDYNLDLEYLKEVWDKQEGICPYTKIKMLIPKSTSDSIKCNSLKKASLDRINSDFGYIKGNVEFVCLFINLAKNSFTKKETEEFIIEILNSSVKNGGAAGQII